MAQTVSELPKGIFSSCANLFLFQTKDAADRDMVLPRLGKSEKGMVNTEYKRYLARIPKTYAMHSTMSPSWVTARMSLIWSRS